MDSRDLQEEFEELEQLKEDGEDYDKEELKELLELKEEVEGMGWEHGIHFIKECDFRDYAEELFDDCYAHDIPEGLRGYIDYESFARDLEFDYTSVSFRGIDYLYREA
jgi:antirestriction protein